MRVVPLTVVLLATVSFASSADPECLYRKIRNLPTHWANPLDCGRFYRCANKDVKREIVCPGGRHYSSQLGKCVPKKQAECKLTFEAPMAGNDNACANEVDGAYVAQSGYCRDYYICSGKQAYPQKCDSSSLFDSTTTNCIPDENTTCWQNFCNNKADGTYLGDGTSCLTFYVCQGQQTVKQTCSDGSYFNATDSNCQPDRLNDICWENFCLGKNNGAFVADPTDCYKFYICNNEQVTKQSCGNGSYFNKEDLTCQPGVCPDDECTDAPTSSPPPPTEEVCTCPGGWDAGDFVPHFDNCSLFYICEDSVLKLQSCGAGLIFDKSTDSCVKGKCPDSTSFLRSKRAVAEPAYVLKRTCLDKYHEGQFIEDANDCRKFQICMGDHLFEQDCGVGNYFDQDLLTCQMDTKNICRSNAVVEGNETVQVEPAVTADGCDCPGGIPDKTLVAHPGYCYMYYLCDNGKLVSGNCGTGNKFDDCTASCVPDVSNCCWSSTNKTNPCYEKPDNTQVADLDKCNGYFLCENNEANPETCPAGEWFDPQLGACDEDVQGVCINPCTGTTGIVFLPAPDCTKFYFCNNGTANLETCPEGKGFDVNKGVCSTGVTCESNMCSSGQDGQTYPYPGDDTKFYVCINGMPTIRNCNAGTTYDQELEICMVAPSKDCNQTMCVGQKDEDVNAFETISGDLSAFCLCRNGSAFKLDCQYDLLFNPEKGVCYSDAPCDPADCEFEEDYKVFPNRNDTQSFCLCVMNEPVSVKCPRNGTFNSFTGHCAILPVPDPNCVQAYCQTAPEWSTYPGTNSSNGFCVCQENIGVYHPCKPGTTFNPSFGICLETQPQGYCDAEACIGNAGLVFGVPSNPFGFCYCESETVVQELACPNGERFNAQLSICMADPCNTTYCLDPANDNTDFPANNYTYGFCRCENNVAQLYGCPAGYEFDPNRLICLPDFDVECNITLCANATVDAPYPTPALNDKYGFCYCTGPDTVMKKSCPPGKYYSIGLQICIDERTPNENCTCPGGYEAGQLLPHPAYIQQYYVCEDSILQLQTCGDDECFSPSALQCQKTSTGTCPAVTSALTCVGAYHEGEIVPHTTDPQKYYVCYKEKLIEQTCSIGHIFDRRSTRCIPASNWKQLRSARGGTIDFDGSEEDHSNNSPLNCRNNEKRSVPANCSQYEICLDAKWRRRTCPHQHYYNPEQQKCLEPSDDTVCLYAKVSGLPECNNETENQTLPSKSVNCKHYFRCTHSGWQLRSCSKQQLYSRQLHTCIKSMDESICHEEATHESSWTNPTKSNCRHAAIRHYSNNCAMYLMCLESDWWYQYCPLGMYFNRTNNYCMPNDNGQCGEAAAAKGKAAPQLEITQLQCNREGALRPSALACNKYFVCIRESWVQRSCAPAQYFNVTSEACLPDIHHVCDPNLAECKDQTQRALPLNCTAFELCQNGTWERAVCPASEAFDDVVALCVSNHDGRCSSKGLRRACRNGDSYAFPLAVNCTQFYYCEQERWHVGLCLVGQTFDAKKKSCVPHAPDDSCKPFWLDEDASPTKESTLIALPPREVAQMLSPLNESDAGDSSCLERPDGSSVPNPDDCRFFYVCSQGKPTIQQQCILGSYYDAEVRYCRPNDGACRVPFTGICENATDNALLPHPHDCHAYYHCSSINGTQLLRCPAGQYYHSFTRQCRVDHGECGPSNAGGAKCTDLNHGIRLPHEQYCNIYYACVHGLAIPVECPENHQFNAILGQCLYDEEEQCQDGQLKGNGTAVSCGKLEDGSYIPDRADCTRYYICSDGLALPKRCESAAYFDSQLLLCVPDDGSCPFVDDDQPNNHPVPPDPVVCENKHGNLMPDPLNCNEFYICVNGKLHHERCYKDHFFNVTANQCQQYERVAPETEEPVSSEAQVIANKAPVQCTDKPANFDDLCAEIPEGTSIAEQGDCRRYVTCTDDAPLSQRCRNGESFDSLLGFCRQNDGTCLMENGQRVGECNGLHGQLTRDADNCRGFFVCINGQKIPRTCADDEYFSRTMNTCQKDEAKQCNPVASKTDEVNGVICIGLSESVLYPYIADNCRSYFQCIKGVPKIHECADGLYFDASSTRCVKDITDCAMPTVNLQRAPEDNLTESELCTNLAVDQLYPNYEDNCRSYYRCRADNTVMYLSCPEKTLFSAEIGACADEEIVICSA